jgi:hypothetical protein
MSTTTTLPLLLELSPVQYAESSASQQETLKAEHDMMGIKYNPLTQVTEDSTGVPQMSQHTVVDTIVVDQNGHYLGQQIDKPDEIGFDPERAFSNLAE